MVWFSMEGINLNCTFREKEGIQYRKPLLNYSTFETLDLMHIGTQGKHKANAGTQRHAFIGHDNWQVWDLGRETRCTCIVKASVCV